MIQDEMVSVATGISERKPRIILEGAVWQLSRSLARAFCCPAKGQPLQESFGVFLLAQRIDRVLLSRSQKLASELPTGYTDAALKAAGRVLRVLRGTNTGTSDKSDPQGERQPRSGVCKARNVSGLMFATSSQLIPWGLVRGADTILSVPNCGRLGEYSPRNPEI